jgi:hypothetical protein
MGIGIGLTFVLLNTLMLIGNATVTTIQSIMIFKAVKEGNRKEE